MGGEAGAGERRKVKSNVRRFCDDRLLGCCSNLLFVLIAIALLHIFKEKVV